MSNKDIFKLIFKSLKGGAYSALSLMAFLSLILVVTASTGGIAFAVSGAFAIIAGILGGGATWLSEKEKLLIHKEISSHIKQLNETKENLELFKEEHEQLKINCAQLKIQTNEIVEKYNLLKIQVESSKLKNSQPDRNTTSIIKEINPLDEKLSSTAIATESLNCFKLFSNHTSNLPQDVPIIDANEISKPQFGSVF